MKSTCLITSPPNTLKSAHKLVQAFRDVLNAHKTFFQDGRMLHSNVSVQNITIIIIIIDDHSHGGERLKGILVDLDVAMELDTGPKHSASSQELGRSCHSGFRSATRLTSPATIWSRSCRSRPRRSTPTQLAIPSGLTDCTL